VGEREQRLARNEAAYREVNEAIHAGRSDGDDGRPRPFACECGMLGCNTLVELTLDEYEAVRADPRHFFLVEGHEIADIEKVIERTPRFAVVEKIGPEAEIVEQLDPRGGGAA
jgi:hypothetical protein